MSLSTDFVKVAQSGKTIDGREIKPEWLLDAAETYNKSIYTASVFPDHNEMAQSYGTVEALRAEKKGEVVSLFAKISPNAFWQSDLRYGQNLFTSIAVMPNFAGTGKWYLYSLAATNNPASLGIEQLQFSKKTNAETLFSEVFNTQKTDVDSDKATESEIISFFSRLFKFKQETNEMADNKALEELQTKFSALETDVNKLKAKQPGNSGGEDQAAKFTALESENTALKTKVAALESENSEFKTKLDAVSVQFSELKTKLDDALKEDPSRSSKGEEFSREKVEDETVFA